MFLLFVGSIEILTSDWGLAEGNIRISVPSKATVLPALILATFEPFPVVTRVDLKVVDCA